MIKKIKREPTKTPPTWLDEIRWIRENNTVLKMYYCSRIVLWESYFPPTGLRSGFRGEINFPFTLYIITIINAKFRALKGFPLKSPIVEDRNANILGTYLPLSDSSKSSIRRYVVVQTWIQHPKSPNPKDPSPFPTPSNSCLSWTVETGVFRGLSRLSTVKITARRTRS